MASAEQLALARERQKVLGKFGGRPKAQHTILAEKMRETLVKKVNKQWEPVIDAQIDLAVGHQVMMSRRSVKQKDGSYKRTGEWYQVTDPNEIASLLNEEDEDNFYKIYTKSPEVNAARQLIEQTIGKPKEDIKVQHEVVTLAMLVHRLET